MLFDENFFNETSLYDEDETESLRSRLLYLISEFLTKHKDKLTYAQKLLLQYHYIKGYKISQVIRLYRQKKGAIAPSTFYTYNARLKNKIRKWILSRL